MIAHFQFPLIFFPRETNFPQITPLCCHSLPRASLSFGNCALRKGTLTSDLSFPRSPSSNLQNRLSFGSPRAGLLSAGAAPLHTSTCLGAGVTEGFPTPETGAVLGGCHVHHAAAQQGDVELQGSGPAAPSATPSKALLQEGKGSFLPSRCLTQPVGARDKAAPFLMPGEVFKAGGAFPGPSPKSLWCRLQESPGFEGMLEALAEAE